MPESTPLPAGPALDAAVAQQVMGWTVIETPAGLWWYPPKGTPALVSASLVPAYSTTWKGMGLVVERLHAQGWTVSMGVSDDFGCECTVWRFSAGDSLSTVVHTATRMESLPHAIALAALKTVEGKDD